MSEFWRFLLDIDKIPGSVSWNQLEFGWERAFPGWVWGLVLFGAGLLSIWSYSALVGGRSGRGTLAFGRFVFLILLVIVLSGPTLVYPREHTERDWVLMLVDRSQSMTVPDVKLTSGRGRVSRDDRGASGGTDSARGNRIADGDRSGAGAGVEAGRSATGERCRVIQRRANDQAAGPGIDSTFSGGGDSDFRGSARVEGIAGRFIHS